MSTHPIKVTIIKLTYASIRFAFCMCNPPFYESQEQYERGVELKQTPPSSVTSIFLIYNIY